MYGMVRTYISKDVQVRLQPVESTLHSLDGLRYYDMTNIS
jgi:hypothetical protein